MDDRMDTADVAGVYTTIRITSSENAGNHCVDIIALLLVSTGCSLLQEVSDLVSESLYPYTVLIN